MNTKYNSVHIQDIIKNPNSIENNNKRGDANKYGKHHEEKIEMDKNNHSVNIQDYQVSKVRTRRQERRGDITKNAKHHETSPNPKETSGVVDK